MSRKKKKPEPKPELDEAVKGAMAAQPRPLIVDDLWKIIGQQSVEISMLRGRLMQLEAEVQKASTETDN